MPEPLAEKIASEAIWEPHKNTIKRVYLSEDKSLVELQKVMTSFYNFDASKSQYERYFKKWGFRKNLKGQEWKAVDHHLSKRKRAGRESELYVDGVLVPKKKVQKETSRNGFMTIWERYARAPSPEMPAGVVVRTPPSSNVDPFTAENIPWFKFRSMFWSQVTQQWISSSLTSFRPDRSEFWTHLQMASNPLITFRSALRTLISTFQREIITTDLRNIDSYVVAVSLSAYAEEFVDFHQRLLGPYHHDTMMECLAVMIYFASNKSKFWTGDIAYTISHWLFLPDKLNVLRHLLSIKGPTTEALAGSIFGFAIEATNMIVIRTMLYNGMNPNLSRTRVFLTPLQHASETGNLELTHLLLNAGAEVDAPRSTYFWDSFTPLMLAVQTRKNDLVKLLISANANVNVENKHGDTALILAIKSGNLYLAEILISAGANVNHKNYKGESVMSTAVDSGSTKLIERIPGGLIPYWPGCCPRGHCPCGTQG